MGPDFLLKLEKSLSDLSLFGLSPTFLKNTINVIIPW